MATRKLLFTGSTVLLAGDTNVDELLQAFAEQPIIFEVSTPTAQQFAFSKSHMHNYLSCTCNKLLLNSQHCVTDRSAHIFSNSLSTDVVLGKEVLEACIMQCPHATITGL